jgi:hypothetical protein
MRTAPIVDTAIAATGAPFLPVTVSRVLATRRLRALFPTTVTRCIPGLRARTMKVRSIEAPAPIAGTACVRRRAVKAPEGYLTANTPRFARRSPGLTRRRRFPPAVAVRLNSDTANDADLARARVTTRTLASSALSRKSRNGTVRGERLRYLRNSRSSLVRTRIVTSEISQIRYHSRIAPF